MKIIFGWDLMYHNFLESSAVVMGSEFNYDQTMVESFIDLTY